MTVNQSIRMVPGAGIEPARLFRPRDFKSQYWSAYVAVGQIVTEIWKLLCALYVQ